MVESEDTLSNDKKINNAIRFIMIILKTIYTKILKEKCTILVESLWCILKHFLKRYHLKFYPFKMKIFKLK